VLNRSPREQRAYDARVTERNLIEDMGQLLYEHGVGLDEDEDKVIAALLLLERYGAVKAGAHIDCAIISARRINFSHHLMRTDVAIGPRIVL
jgi:hypothetical protein